MKKLFTLLAMLTLAVTSTWAQWKPSDTDFTVVGTDSIYNQGGLKTLHTPQGNVVVTWVEWPKGMRYDNPLSGYYLHMQVYDKDGKAKFPQGGMLVSSKPTPSSTTDYGLSLADNGDILLAYFDVRNDANKQNMEMYAYRYTQDGQPVWDADGICFTPKTQYNRGHELVPQIVASGDNVYFGCYHTEYYNVKADSTNWEPSPFYPDEEMPDSVTVGYSTYQLQCMKADGTFAWAEPKVFDTANAYLYAAPEGNLYFVYTNNGYGLDAQLINANGDNAWGKVVNVEKESLSGGSYMSAPTVVPDDQGGLVFGYRKLLTYSGYATINHLQNDGTVWEEAVLCNGSTDGDASSIEVGTKGDRALVAWSYRFTDNSLLVNEFSLDGDYVWEGDSLLGYPVAANEMWGVRPVAVIPQQDGWVLLYGDGQSWNGANFYAEKIDDNGRTIWKKQIAENDFKSSGFAITNDDQNAYIFYTCDKEVGDDWQEIPGPGGLRLMVVDITDATNGIATPAVNENNTQETTVYNAQGMKLNNMSQPGLYVVKSGKSVKKVIVK